MQRGIVIDVHSKHWVVMTTDGLFIKVPIQDPSIQPGEEVSFSLAQMPKQWNWKRYVTGAVAAIFALFFLFTSFSENEALADTYVYVEIDPGIEIGLNEKLEVIRVHPIDKQAETLLNQIDWKKKSVNKVVVDYLNQAKDQGYLRKKDEIVLSAINEKGSSRSTLQSIEQVIDQDPQVGKKELDLLVFAFSLPKEIQQKAASTGLTPGKYGVWLLSKKSGREIPVNQIAKTSISELMNEVPMLDHPPSENEWKEIVNTEGEKNQTPVNSTDQSDTKQDEVPDPSKEQNSDKTTPTTEQKKQSPTTDKKEEEPPSTKDPADGETKPKTDDQEKSEAAGGSTSGSTGDSDSQTNHAAP